MVDSHVADTAVDAQQLIVGPVHIAFVGEGLQGEQPAAAHFAVAAVFIECGQIAVLLHVDLAGPLFGQGKGPAVAGDFAGADQKILGLESGLAAVGGVSRYSFLVPGGSGVLELLGR